MNRKRIILITFILSVLLSACEFDKMKFGEVRMMYGTNEAGRISYDISTFTGIESGEFDAETDQLISFTYSVDLDKGALFIEWQDPQGEVVWEKELSKSDHGEGEFGALYPGVYRILIRGVGAGGRFDVSWQEK